MDKCKQALNDSELLQAIGGFCVPVPHDHLCPKCGSQLQRVTVAAPELGKNQRAAQMLCPTCNQVIPWGDIIEA